MNLNNKEFNMLDEVISSIYKRGLESGSADVKMRVEGAYEKGLEDAWACARKIKYSSVEGGYTAFELLAIFGTSSTHEVFKKYSASEAMQKIKEYEEQQKQDEIKVGDEVRIKGSGWKGQEE